MGGRFLYKATDLAVSGKYFYFAAQTNVGEHKKEKRMKKAVKSCKVARGICLNYYWPPPEMRLKAPKPKEVFYQSLG